MDGTKTIAVTVCREKSNKHRTKKGKNLQVKMSKLCILTIRRPKDRLPLMLKIKFLIIPKTLQSQRQLSNMVWNNGNSFHVIFRCLVSLVNV